MPVFRLPEPGYTIAVKGLGNVRFPGRQQYVEVTCPLTVKALQNSPNCEERDALPPEDVCSFVEASNHNAVYPLPDFGTLPIVLIGRGKSSDKFWERFPAGEFHRVGVNPGSYPQNSEETDGRHREVPQHFDAVISVDSIYLQERGAEFLSRYKGPVIGPSGSEPNYQGVGTYHSLDPVARKRYGLSGNFGPALMAGFDPPCLILCGYDCEGRYSGLRAGILAAMRMLREEGTVIWRDPDCPFEELGKPWKAPKKRKPRAPRKKKKATKAKEK